MRIFTVASEELISKPVSLVSMVKTERIKMPRDMFNKRKTKLTY